MKRDERMAQEIVALCIHQFLCTAYGEASLIAAVVLCHLCATGEMPCERWRN